MSSEITVAHIDTFKRGVRQLQQQMPSRFRGAVRVETGIHRWMAFDQLDAGTMQAHPGRHAPTVLTDTAHRRRWVEAAAAVLADMIDPEDAVRTLNQFANPYAVSFVMAANRWCDDQIIAAFAATATTGEDRGGTAAFPAGMIVDAGAAAGMTLAKLIEARMLLEASENREDSMNPWYVAMGAKQRQALLEDTTLTSADYNTVRALVNGQINQFLGFTFVKSERLTLTVAVRSCPAWGKESMCLGVNQEINTSFDKRPDLNNGLQVLTRQDMGATRMDEKGVVIIECDES